MLNTTTHTLSLSYSLTHAHSLTHTHLITQSHTYIHTLKVGDECVMKA